MAELSIKLKSNYLNDNTQVTVIMPNPPMTKPAADFYKSGKKYKVLWLLHGGRDTLKDWVTFSNVPRLALQYGFIMVLPNGGDSDYVNHPEIGDGFMFQDYFFEELMPLIYNWLPASSKPEDNFLAGNSMGCAASWQYAVQYPEKFGCVAPLCNQPLDYRYLEEYRSMSTAEFRAKALSSDNPFLAAYGVVGERMHVKEVNTICKYTTVGDFLDSPENTMEKVEKAAAARMLPKMYIPCGTEPRDLKLLKFKEQMESIGADNMTFDVTDEPTHCFAFWEKAVEKFIKFLGIPKIDYYIGV